jgi:hypothetical protein
MAMRDLGVEAINQPNRLKPLWSLHTYSAHGGEVLAGRTTPAAEEEPRTGLPRQEGLRDGRDLSPHAPLQRSMGMPMTGVRRRGGSPCRHAGA